MNTQSTEASARLPKAREIVSRRKELTVPTERLAKSPVKESGTTFQSLNWGGGYAHLTMNARSFLKRLAV
jgi:hypothetical protein